MDISKLNQRIEIQKGVSKTDEVGNVIRHWQDYYSCFASVNTAGGKEISAVDYRIVFRGKTYNIIQVDFADYDGKTIKIKAESEESYGSIGTGNDK